MHGARAAPVMDVRPVSALAASRPRGGAVRGGRPLRPPAIGGAPARAPALGDAGRILSVVAADRRAWAWGGTRAGKAVRPPRPGRPRGVCPACGPGGRRRHPGLPAPADGRPRTGPLPRARTARPRGRRLRELRAPLPGMAAQRRASRRATDGPALHRRPLRPPARQYVPAQLPAGRRSRPLGRSRLAPDCTGGLSPSAFDATSRSRPSSSGRVPPASAPSRIAVHGQRLAARPRDVARHAGPR